MKKKLITIMTVALMLMGCGYVEDKESSVQAGGPWTRGEQPRPPAKVPNYV